MSAIEQAEELRQQAIQLLLAEQERLGESLLQLGYDQENSPAGKRRGRRPKVATEPGTIVNEVPTRERVDEVSAASGSIAQTVQDRGK
jgi:hypothetical protein